MEYRVTARRVDAHGSLARAKAAEVVLDTDLAGRSDAMNPVELLLAALAACMLKGIGRVTPMLDFRIDGAEVTLEAVRQDAPPKLVLIRYEIVVDSPESDRTSGPSAPQRVEIRDDFQHAGCAVPMEGRLVRALIAAVSA